MKIRSLIVTSTLLLLTACAGTSNTTTTSTGAAAVNSTCPMSGENIDATCTTTFDGKTVGFCCNSCKTKFNGMNNADKQAKVTSATPAK